MYKFKNLLKRGLNKRAKRKLLKRSDIRLLKLPKRARLNWKCISMQADSSFALDEYPIVNGSLQCQREGASMQIGKYFFLGSRSDVVSTESVIIGDHVMISHDCYISDTDGHSLDPDVRRKDLPNRWNDHKDWTVVESAPVVIGDDVWLGPKVVVLKGVTIGSGAVVAAGSIVVKDVAEMTVVAGVPAKPIKKLN